MPMTQQQALEVMVPLRGDRIVVTTMSSAGIWPRLSDSPLDFAYIPSAMGHAPGIGLGLALAHPERGVIVVNGDGCMLMNLGSLVTLAEQAAPVYLLILDNGLYEVTGGQAYAGAGSVNFAQMARGRYQARLHLRYAHRLASRCARSVGWRRARRNLAQGGGPRGSKNSQTTQADARANRPADAGANAACAPAWRAGSVTPGACLIARPPALLNKFPPH